MNFGKESTSPKVVIGYLPIFDISGAQRGFHPEDFTTRNAADVEFSNMPERSVIIAELVALAADALLTDRMFAKAYLDRVIVFLGADKYNQSSIPIAAPVRRVFTSLQMKRIADYVSNNINGPIRNNDLARVAHVSRSYLSRAFKSTINQSPRGYVMLRRIERAKEMILNSDEPVGQIAIACGFADQAHLSRMFRQHVGETPVAWRKARSLRSLRHVSVNR